MLFQHYCKQWKCRPRAVCMAVHPSSLEAETGGVQPRLAWASSETVGRKEGHTIILNVMLGKTAS